MQSKTMIGLSVAILAAGGVFYAFPISAPTHEVEKVPTTNSVTKKDPPVDEVMKQPQSTYSEYKEGVIGNGDASLLFFHAQWCPACRQGDSDLRALYETGVPRIATYKVDYDTSAELKKKYGVTYQHTFVLIDGEGNAVKTLLGPSLSELTSLVK